MTLEYLAERLNQLGKPLTEEQMNSLSNRFGPKAYFSAPICSKLPYVEASLRKEHAYILHPNGCIDRKFHVDEANSLGLAYWKDVNNETLVFIAYF